MSLNYAPVAPDPAGGELTALPRLPGWTKRVLLLRKGKGCREGEGKGRKGREWGGRDEIGRELEEGGRGREVRGKEGKNEGGGRERNKGKGRGDSQYQS